MFMTAEIFKITHNPDGTITRHFAAPTIPASTDLNSPSPVLTKDVPLNPSYNTSLRLFLPKQVIADASATSSKLPIILYFHGGGFVFFHPSCSIMHDFCVEMASQLNALVISVDYRLAPEHRLPAAYEDAGEAIEWIKGNQDDEEWLSKYGDYSNLTIMGSSAGANILYHTALNLSSDILAPLKLRGMIMHEAYFGAEERTEWELKSKDPVITLEVSDMFWDCALPIGSDHDHPYCNPRKKGTSFDQQLEKIKGLGCPIYFVDCDGDILFAQQAELAKIMVDKGINVTTRFREGGHHALDLLDANKAKELFVDVKKFMLSC